MADQIKTGTQKRQIKLSGLIGKGVISPQQQDESGSQYRREITDTTSDSQEELAPKAELSLGQVNRFAHQENMVVKITVALVDDSPYQPRLVYDSAEIDELAHSLAAAGQEEAIQVRERNGRYELIAGHRRIRAARNLGWAEIDAIVTIKDDREAALSTMVHNEGSSKLCNYEHAKLYQAAKDGGFAKTQEEIAKLFATTQTHVSRCLLMLNLPPAFVALLDHSPRLFGVKGTEIISSLLKAHPSEQSIIEQGVLRLKDGAPESALKGWVEQMIKQKNAPTKSNRPKVITNKTGRQMFTVKRENRVITLRISAPDVDGDTTMQKITDALRMFTENELNE